MIINVDEKLIRSVAKNSCLKLSNEEIISFESDFKDILTNFEKLDEIDVTNIAPSFHPIKVEDKVREDIAISNPAEEKAVLNNVKFHQDRLIRGPKIL